MISDKDTRLEESFAATFDHTDDSDWSDVLRRAGTARRRRRLVLTVGVAGLVVVAAASAIVFSRSTVDFLAAGKAPQSVVVNFGSIQVGAPPGMAPGVRPHQARRITVVSINGKQHVLYVAPTRAGGFCEDWTKLDGGCRAKRVGPLGVTTTGGGATGVVTLINGEFFQSGGVRLVVRFADGTSAEIPFVWVTNPIDAGFYIYRVPDANRTLAHRPTSVTLYNSKGEAITHTSIEVPTIPQMITHHLRGFPPLPVPAQAIYSQRQKLFDIKVAKGHRIGLWVAPERGGGTCMWGNREFGCTANGATAARATRIRAKLEKEGKLKPLPLTALSFLGVQGGNPVMLCCAVGKHVARVALRFQDGTSIELVPKEHYLLAVIPPNHYSQGHRLDEMVAYSRSGKVLDRKPIDAQALAVYPCSKPNDLGYGVKECP